MADPSAYPPISAEGERKIQIPSPTSPCPSAPISRLPTREEKKRESCNGYVNLFFHYNFLSVFQTDSATIDLNAQDRGGKGKGGEEKGFRVLDDVVIPIEFTGMPI